MTAQLDINTLASWATVLVAAVGVSKFGRRASRWFERTNERLEQLEKQQAATEKEVKQINAQLRPNGGNSHHDVMRREIQEAAAKAAKRERRRSWW